MAGLTMRAILAAAAIALIVLPARAQFWESPDPGESWLGLKPPASDPTSVHSPRVANPKPSAPGMRHLGEGNEPASHTAFQARRIDDLIPPPDPDMPLPEYRRGDFREGERPKPLAVDSVFMSRAGINDTNTSVVMSQVGFNYQFRIPFGDRFMLTIRPLADIMFLSGPGDPLELPPQLYKIAFDFQSDLQITETVGLSFGTTPGLWTDFVKLNGDAFRIPFRVLGTVRIRDDLFLAGGAWYTDNIQENVFPIGGVIWDISDRIRAELLFPRARVVYRMNDIWQIYGVAEGYGGTWSIRTNVNGNLYNELVLYRDLRLMLGTQVDYFRRVSLFVETGAVVDRKFKFNDSIQPNVTVDPSFVLRVGTRF